MIINHNYIYYGVRTTEKFEAFLNITSSALIIEKVLMHLKHYQQMAGCMVTVIDNSMQNNEQFITKYKNMEVEDPKSSFVDEPFLQNTYALLTGKKHDQNPSDYEELKKILIALENVRNISAHGGAVNFDSSYNTIYSYLFFVVFRLVPINLLPHS